MYTIQRSGLVAILLLFAATAHAASPAEKQAFIVPHADGTHFVKADTQEPFRAWGVNYDHDHDGRLLEAYWTKEWDTVVEDFHEIQQLGANVVRIHLQVSAFMKTPESPNQEALGQLGKLVKLAEETGLYLDLTGLGCYHKEEVPEWYDALPEAERWAVQTRFWEAVAETCAESPAIFCYDLMNEPILPGKDTEEDWLAGEFGGKYFVQRIALDLKGRTRKAVAKAWVDQLVAGIRKHDTRHMVTVGAIPWAKVFPKAKPLFYDSEVGENLDFVSVHFYPEKGKVDEALTALSVYEVGKPLVVEEMFPLKCGIEELEAFIDRSRGTVDGYISFYWGKTIEDFAQEESPDFAGALTKTWLDRFRDRAPQMKQPPDQE